MKHIILTLDIVTFMLDLITSIVKFSSGNIECGIL